MIALSRVSKHYGRRALLVDASFQLDPGDKVGLVGPDGSGKSTLFRLIVGEEAPDDGEVSVPLCLRRKPSSPEWSALAAGRVGRQGRIGKLRLL
jgi:ATPase subunit of ABC transporter with duplicated ATPase domains